MKQQNLRLFTTIAAVGILVLAAGCTSDVDKLAKELKSPDPMVRWNAATALGKTGSAEAIEPLVEALDDDALGVRNEAIDALVAIGPKAGKAISAKLTDARDEVKTAALFALALIGDSNNGPAAAKLLNDKSAAVRIEAARTLEKIGDWHVMSSLRAATMDKDAAVKAAVDQALKKVELRRKPFRPMNSATMPATSMPTSMPKK